MTRHISLIFLFASVLLLSGCTMQTEEVRKEAATDDTLKFYPDANTGSDASSQAPPASKAPQTPPSSPNTLSNKKMYTTQPQMTIDQTKKYAATLKTDVGDIEVALNAKMVPITVNNFVFLAREKFYDNTVFHRVIKGFMIQGGDPDGTGMGGPGYRFDDEPFTGAYTRGTVAMANAGPDTNGSQFFIMHKDSPLPPNYTIFGHVTAGVETVDKIAEAETKPGGEGSSPVTPIQVRTIEITEK